MTLATHNAPIPYQKYMTLYVAAHIPVYLVTAILFSLPVLIPIILQAVMTVTMGLSLFVRKFSPSLSLDLSAMGISMTPAVLVYMLSGNTWQLDAHMYFFAVLAMTIGFKSIRAALMAAGLIAVHHLGLNFIMPLALYPEGANFFRVLFHAVIVIAETAVICMTIYGLQRNDERITQEGNAAKAALEAANEAKRQQDEAEIKAKEERKQMLDNVAVNFDSTMGSLIKSLGESSTELQNIAHSMQAIADTTSQATEKGVSATSEASHNVSTIAQAMEEMSATSEDISKQMSGVKDKSHTMATNAQNANQTVTDLDKLAQGIGEVVIAIRDIAEQTNLLALNATIEAARAGESGKGFAVVAEEVKKLANETARKTQEIDMRISDIQNAAQKSVAAMDLILRNISEIDASVIQASASVSQQSESTANITRNILHTSSGVEEVSGIILNVSKGSDETRQYSDTVLQAASHVAGLSGNLKQALDHFLTQIRDDTAQSA